MSAPTAAPVAVTQRAAPGRAAGGSWVLAGGALPWQAHAALFALFVGASYLGRSTAIEQADLALLWPAGGVAAAWLFLAAQRHRAVIVVLLAATSLGVHATTGATGWLAIGFTVANLGQVLPFLVLVRRWCPQLWGVAGDRPLAEIGSLTRVTVAAALAAVAGVAAGEAVLALAPVGPGGEVAVVWAGRNFAGLLSVFAITHLVAYRVSDQVRYTSVPAWEWLAVVVVTAAVYVPVFWQDSLPLAFVPSMLVLWIGWRSDAVVAVAHALLGGAIAVVLTIAGRGPFSLVEDTYDRALVVQLFLTGVLVTAVYLSAAREERAHAANDLAIERRRVDEQAELLEAAVANVSDGLVVMAADGEILNANPAARQVLQLLAPDRVTGSGLRRPDGTPIPREQSPSMRALRGELVVREEVTITDLTGAHRTFSVNATPLTGVGLARAVVTFRDVTDERAQVDELSAFASVVAHDLRGPLTSLDGWADMAQRAATGTTGTPDELLLALQRVRSSSSRLSDLLEGLLVHATSRDRELVREPVDVGALVREVAAARDVESRVEVRHVPAVVGDAVMLHHLFDNLVGNAVKYVADGVVPHLVVEGRREGRWVVVDLTDNGIGVPESMRRTVFERFSRVAGTGRKGTGLGLSICRTIVERHGGEIAVTDGTGGVGSRFTVRLPAG